MLTDDEIKAILKGCKGVTPGPWTSYPGDRFESAFVRGPDGHVVAWDQTPADAAHIARCDPTTIAELCTRLLAAEARVKALEETGTAILDFYNGPLEAKRPDVFQRLMVRLAAALQEQSK
jgi:hypothetical protein